MRELPEFEFVPRPPRRPCPEFAPRRPPRRPCPEFVPRRPPRRPCPESVQGVAVSFINWLVGYNRPTLPTVSALPKTPASCSNQEQHPRAAWPSFVSGCWGRAAGYTPKRQKLHQGGGRGTRACLVGRVLRQRRSGRRESAPAVRHSRAAAGPTTAGEGGVGSAVSAVIWLRAQRKGPRRRDQRPNFAF